MTSIIFYNIVENINIEMIKKDRFILLFLDNAPSHKIDAQYSNVKIQLLPPNCTANLQSLDMDVIRSPNSLVEDADKGLTYKPSIRDAIITITKSQHGASIDTISNCLITGIIEGNPEPEVYETINEEKNIVEEQMTEEHLSDEMILNLINTSVGSNQNA